MTRGTPNFQREGSRHGRNVVLLWRTRQNEPPRDVEPYGNRQIRGLRANRVFELVGDGLVTRDFFRFLRLKTGVRFFNGKRTFRRFQPPPLAYMALLPSQLGYQL